MCIRDRHYGQPKEAIHVVQVELARRLYMDEAKLTKNGGFERMKAWATGLCATLGGIRLDS